MTSLTQLALAGVFGFALAGAAQVIDEPLETGSDWSEWPTEMGWSESQRKAMACEAVVAAIQDAPLEQTVTILKRARGLGLLPMDGSDLSLTLDAVETGFGERPLPRYSWITIDRGVLRELVQIHAEEVQGE